MECKKLLRYFKSGHVWFEGKYDPEPYAGFFRIEKTSKQYYVDTGKPYVLQIGITSPIYMHINDINYFLRTWGFESITEKDFEND